MTPPQIVVSIINYRTADMTIAAVQSVQHALGDRPAQIVIVDNASGDGSAEQIDTWIAKANDERIVLIRSVTNSGFSGGHNQGIAAGPDADFYLILNSDALLRPDFFDMLMPAVEDDRTTGLFAPQLEWEDGTPQISCFRFPRALSEFDRGACSGPVSRVLKRSLVALDMPPDPDRIEWASFACILLRGTMVRDIGLMDTGYFLYFEDAEFALRAGRAGWAIRYVPAARAVHFRGGSGPVKKMQAAKKRLPAYYWKSRTRFLRQAYGPFGPLLANIAWIAGRSVAKLRVFAGRSVPPAHQSESRDIWTGFQSPLKPYSPPET